MLVNPYPSSLHAEKCVSLPLVEDLVLKSASPTCCTSFLTSDIYIDQEQKPKLKADEKPGREGRQLSWTSEDVTSLLLKWTRFVRGCIVRPGVTLL